MENTLTYYIFRNGLDISHVRLKLSRDGPSYFYTQKRIENPDTMIFDYRDPIPRKPKLGDFHFEPTIIVSKRIFEVLNSLDISTMQLIPAKIRGTDGTENNDYYALHTFKEIACLDIERSEVVMRRRGDKVLRIKKMVLDEKKLLDIPLEERLAFRLQEFFSYQIFHESIVKPILELNPTNLSSTKVEDWSLYG